MNKQLLLEGAVAGHMNHIYDNGEMTFGELKQLLQAAAAGKLRGTEKTDGQNIFLSFDIRSQKAKAIRNKTQIKAGGLDAEEFDEFFSGHASQSLRFSFVEALMAFEEVVRELDQDTQLKIFGETGEIYFNTEVMNPGNPEAEEDDPRGQGTTNVIPYDKKTLLIHAVGHQTFNRKTALPLDVDLSANYAALENALMGKSTEDPSVFSVETHPNRKLEPPGLKKANEILEPTIEAIDNIIRDQGLNDSDTINNYVVSQLGPIIDQFGMTEDRNKMLLQRMMMLCKRKDGQPGFLPCGTKDSDGNPLTEPRPTMREITAGIPQELRDDIKALDGGFKYGDYTNNLKNALYDFSNVILQNFESSFIADNDGTIRRLQDEIQQSIDKIKKSSNEAAKQDLEKQMTKLKDVQNINTPSEGFVFDFNGFTYKFTGAFAPANQILGTERYNRFGPIEPSEELEEPLGANLEPLVIGVVPGAFKPPHKGHLSMVESLAENVDKVIVIISKPLKSGRILPMSKKPIDSNHAEQIWKAFLDKSPAGPKTVVIQSPAASPVGVTYDFVMQEPDVTNQLIAPSGATVLLGCGDKEEDSSRYETIVKKARKDLKIEIQVCDLVVKHTEEYVQFLQENPEILENLPSNRKSTVEVEDLHASDMRYMIDIAAQNAMALTLLEDFVPNPEDALAVMGILGMNPADPGGPEEDQVREPEIDQLAEIIYQEAEAFYESFRAQRAPKGRPSKDKFQRKMRKRLAKAHKTYLDMGRKDLTRYGGGFHLDRPKNISNAFLAEDEIEEVSISGNIQGAPNKKNYKRKDKMQKEEKKLRLRIKEGLKKFFFAKADEHSKNIAAILEEHQLRLHLRDIIFEQFVNEVEDPSTDIHDSTGINTLKDLLKNTNILSTLRTVYKTLTTDEEQKISFRAHIIQWVQNTLAPVKLNDTEPDAISEAYEDEDVGIDIEGVDSSKFIDADDGSEKDLPDKNEEEEEDVMEPISGADTTGRNKAERVYPTIEKSVVDYYSELDNSEDQEMFYDYLIANLKLYFDKWDSEMSNMVEEPSNEEYEQAKASSGAAI